MATEKEIRAFFKENKISFPEGDNFMNEVLRQIDLLPVPEALKNKDEGSLQIIREICSAFEKWSHRRAFTATLFSVACGIAVAIMTDLFTLSGTNPGEILAKSLLTCAVISLSRRLATRLYPPFRLRNKHIL